MDPQIVSRSGHLQLPEGKLYWVADDVKPSTFSSGETRPKLLFVHAGVADHTLWDEQARFFSSRAWDVWRYDLFGYGQSDPSDEFLRQSPRLPIKHYDHLAKVVKHLQTPALDKGEINNDFRKVIVVGLSRGGCIAIDFTLAYPNLVAGLVIIAGGVTGYEVANTAAEEAIFAQESIFQASKDSQGLANLNVRLWGDGPLQEPGRLDERVRFRLLQWCTRNAIRECNFSGGSAIEEEGIVPPAIGRLVEITVPIGIASGKLDESSTIAAMRYVAKHANRATMHEFDTAHMVNLEKPTEFNAWLEAWLRKNFL
ncbi:hypothetical protein MMC14_005491 [Varicellaria rhodocarpa]|nr:hypothetical protein [Varicellaria rhodocarpa]